MTANTLDHWANFFVHSVGIPATGAIAALVLAVFNAWRLLIEVLR